MVDVNLLTAKDFIGVRAGLVRELGGDGNRALVLTRIFYRADGAWREAHEADGHWWWRARYSVVADETGLSDQQVRRCINWLVKEGHIEAREFRQGGITDRTLSYRVISDLSESTGDVSDSTPQSLSDSTPLPSMQTLKTYKLFDGERTEVEIDHAFDIFWKIYPKHVAKVKARAAFVKALKTTRVAEIVDGARLYQRAMRQSDPKFIAHPTTWLNQERWTDDLGPGEGSGIQAIRELS